MDCRAFRNSHVAFVDDTLPGVEHQAMEEHLDMVMAELATFSATRPDVFETRTGESAVA